MNAFDHAEAHERIADMALEPGRLARLETSTAAADVELRAHVAGCSDCASVVDEWRSVQRALAATLAGGEEETALPVELPADLRERVRAAIRQEAAAGNAADRPPRARQRLSGRRRGVLVGLAAALAIAALLGGAWLVRESSTRLDAAAEQNRALVALTHALARVVAADDRRVVTLLAADGTAAGTLAWTRRDVVIVSSALSDPGADRVYRCWLVHEGGSTAIGRMHFAGGWAYWMGSTDGWASIDFGSGKSFLISLESADAAADRPAGPVVLQAELGG